MTAGRFEGRAEFLAGVVAALQWAAAQGATDVHAWDPSFVDWPWSDALALQALRDWVKPGRRLHLMALGYEELARRHPRFVRWRRDFAHCVNARLAEPETRPEAGPQALLLVSAATQGQCLWLHDRSHWRGIVNADLLERQRARDWFDALTQRSSESFAPTTLGL